MITEAELRSFVDTWRREAKDAQAELGRAKALLEALYGDWTIILPTIVSDKPLNFKQKH